MSAEAHRLGEPLMRGLCRDAQIELKSSHTPETPDDHLHSAVGLPGFSHAQHGAVVPLRRPHAPHRAQSPGHAAAAWMHPHRAQLLHEWLKRS